MAAARERRPWSVTGHGQHGAALPRGPVATASAFAVFSADRAARVEILTSLRSTTMSSSNRAGNAPASPVRLVPIAASMGDMYLGASSLHMTVTPDPRGFPRRAARGERVQRCQRRSCVSRSMDAFAISSPSSVQRRSSSNVVAAGSSGSLLARKPRCSASECAPAQRAASTAYM